MANWKKILQQDDNCASPLTDGTQTIAGVKTFSSDATFSGVVDVNRLKVNGSWAFEDIGSSTLRIGESFGTLQHYGNSTFSGDVIVNNGSTHAYAKIDSGSTSHASWVNHKQGGSERWLVGVEGSQTQYQLYSTLSGNTGTRFTLDASGNGEFTGTATATTFIGALTGNASGSSGSCTGNAATATVLATSRDFRTNLASTSSAGFTGSADCTPGVTGTLPVGNGGTGLTSISTLLNSNVTSVSGNAGTATILATARDIAGQSFNGSASITIDIGDLDNVTVSDSAASGGSTGDIWIEY